MSGIIENLGSAVNSIFRGKTPQVPSQKVHIVPWGIEAFPDDGTGRTLRVKAGDTLHFVPIDDDSHNVAEADIVDERWVPSQERQLGINYRTRRGFNEQLKINKAGTYEFACPIDNHHQVMRLTVVVEDNGNDSQQSKTRLDQAKQQTRLAITDAKQRADEARQAMTQAQQQRTELAQQKAQQASQRAQLAHEKAQDAIKNLGNLAQDFGQDATQVVTDVINSVQKGVGNVATQAMNVVTSLMNPQQQIGPLGPIRNNILENVQILQGTGTFASRFPNFDLGQFNILDQNRVIGPLGPVVKRRVATPVPNSVMVDEEIASFGPKAYNNQHRQAHRESHNDRRVVVRWDSDALLGPDGLVRTLEVSEGTKIVFRSTDGRPHNLVETNSNFSQKKNPIIDTRVNTSTHLDESLNMDKVGTYYFVSTTEPQTMRIIVKVNPDDATDEIIDGA